MVCLGRERERGVGGWVGGWYTKRCVCVSMCVCVCGILRG